MEKDSARAAIQLGLKSLALFEKPSKDLKNIPRNGNGISARAEKRAWTYAVILFSTKQYVSPGWNLSRINRNKISAPLAGLKFQPTQKFTM